MAYTILDREVNLTAPIDMEGITYIPLRAVVEQLGGSISWDNNTKVATSTIGQWTATIQMANENVDVNGQQITLEAPPFVDANGEMLVPLTFFNRVYGYKIGDNNGDISITL